MHLSATSIIGNEVIGLKREPLGEVVDLLVEIDHSRIEYAVVSFGGILGLGERLFAIPLQALTVDTNERCFVLPIEKDVLQSAPGFDKDDWPDAANMKWLEKVNSYYEMELAG